MRRIPAMLALTLAFSAHAADPKTIYQGTCVACHGARGEGTIPGVPNLGKSGRLAKPTAVLVESIMKGMQTPGSPMAMPPKGGTPTLTPADAEALVVYMRGFTPAR